VIVDDAETLRSLITQAGEAAEAGDREEAMTSVESVLSTTHRSLLLRAVANEPYLGQVDPKTREAVKRAAGELATLARRLETASDVELEAIGGHGDQQERGALAAIRRTQNDLANVLTEAQVSLLRGWSNELWPTNERARLDVLAHLPESADAARQVAGLLDTLAAHTVEALPTGDSTLRRLSDNCTAHRDRAQQLRQKSVPEAVVAFWQEARDTEGGVSLRTLSPEVYAWLRTHDALDSFRIAAT
jgi:hypothetical protein